MAGVGGWGGVGFSLCGSSTQGPPSLTQKAEGSPWTGGGLPGERLWGPLSVERWLNTGRFTDLS